jgi:ectoine hydroxylase-related dioxygenase (phytanoyl-CoA dioxygenase family)
MILQYKIDDEIIDVEISDGQLYTIGQNEVLSNKNTDVTFNQDWYSDGYSIMPFLKNEQFFNLKQGITNTISELISDEGIDINGFTLENYHKYIKTDKQHFNIVSKTRDLFPEQFSFNITELIPIFSDLLGFELSDINPKTNDKIHIIVRINRPNSNDYNPPHKDMYEAYDRESYFPRFVNFWVPIAGVTNKTSLPIVPKSHLISENNILRTSEGGIVGGNKYRVRFIREWGDTSLIRTNVTYSEVLIFSSHLIHGLAKNSETDITRVALEFRLFKK